MGKAKSVKSSKCSNCGGEHRRAERKVDCNNWFAGIRENGEKPGAETFENYIAQATKIRDRTHGKVYHGAAPN